MLDTPANGACSSGRREFLSVSLVGPTIPGPVPDVRMAGPAQFVRDALKRGTTARLLRSLLREQTRGSDALEQIAIALNGIGRILAKNSNEPWQDKVTRVPDEAFEDHSSVGAPDDQFFADFEAIRDDYATRFGREISDAEAMEVYEDHRKAREGTVEP